MSVDVNTVYQRVLAITNKEQRGYITPQEFNYMANQAQLDIFEQYFYDLNQFARIPGNSTEYSDMLNILEEKISLFERTGVPLTPYTDGTITLPNDLYRLGSIMYNGIEVEHVTSKEFAYIKQSPLSRPSAVFPIYTRGSYGTSSYHRIKVFTGDINNPVATGSLSTGFSLDGVTCNYIRKPADARWGYDTATGLYNSSPTYSANFELHESEETELVVKILAMAGILLKDPNLYQVGSAEDTKNVQQEKA
jgi:hypothetical protein